MAKDGFIGVTGYGPPAPLEKPLPIDELARMPGDRRWAVADDALLEALALGQQVQRGPMGRRIRSVLKWADRIGLAGLAVLVIGGLELARLLWRQGGAQARGPVPERVFVGFGAGSEALLFERYCAQEQGPVMRLDETEVSTFGAWHAVKPLHGLRTLWSAYRTASRALAQLPPAFASMRLEFLTFVARRLGRYSYTLAWFKRLHAEHPHVREVSFLSADTTSYAAVAAGLSTRYTQHGLVRASLLLPDFDVIEALTEEEGRFFQRRVPGARLVMQAYPRLGTPSLNHGILIASVYGHEDELSLILPALAWARRTGQPVWVRPHPAESRRFWSPEVLGPDVRIEDSDPSFLAALQRLRPRLVLSWFSTALADALQCGIVPVTVNSEGSAALHDLVYPLAERALLWERHGAQIQRALEDDRFYCEVVRDLRQAGSPNEG